jgi:hypothetical protein
LLSLAHRAQPEDTRPHLRGAQAAAYSEKGLQYAFGVRFLPDLSSPITKHGLARPAVQRGLDIPKRS